MDTIFAEATPPGRGGVSVIRISGPMARAALEHLSGPVDEARRSYLRGLRESGDLIDRALILRFAAGESFTGEEVAELHLHGAPVIVRRIEKALVDFGLRRAEAGEFTRRAFLNGRIDLAEAEGLADLLSAETEAQRKLAMKAAEGDLGRIADGFRARLIRAGALVEASIDFADEETPEEIPAEVFEIISAVRRDLNEMLAQYPATERLRQGYEVAIIGPPNAGKSTLINQIAQREVAIVSEHAGTTRDIIELRVDLRGLPVTFLDTAGLRESVDPVETMGVSLAVKRAEAADLRIHLSPEGVAQGILQPGDFVLRSKSDLAAARGGISGLTGAGVAELLESVYDLLRGKAVDSGIVSHRRQAEALMRAVAALDIGPEESAEFVAEAIRMAIRDMAAMVGRIDAENYLDEIFSSFCIGK